MGWLSSSVLFGSGHQESNLELILRRDLLYPFNYSRNVWRRRRESNSHKADRQSAGLPMTHIGNSSQLQFLVPREGLEPTLLTEGDFESPVSTNFATWA